jgi:hypothetical protein
MRNRGLLAWLVVLGGCAGEIGGGTDGPASVAFVTPASGGTIARDTLGDGGWMTAPIGVSVTSSGADRVEIDAEDRVLGDVDTSGWLDAGLRGLGTITLTARAMRGDEEVATATVDVTVIEPDVPDCRAWLDLYHVSYDAGPNNDGVVDPVTVTTPINGVPFRYLANTTERPTFFMDCRLALSLAKAAPYFRERHVTEVADYGVYNYRCISNQGTPPNCTIGMSQHAFAMAIDLAGFTLDDGTFWTVKDDFVINPDGDTCTATPAAGADTFLHELICTLKAAGIWNIVLTPNYNADHRDHFHVDLTPDSDYIKLARFFDDD